MTKVSEADRIKIKAHLVGHHGAEKIKITRDGAVHAYGRLPNSIVCGWYFAGWPETILDDWAAHVLR